MQTAFRGANHKPKVAVIGACGYAGLIAINTLLAHGIDVIGFEKNDRHHAIGGAWATITGSIPQWTQRNSSKHNLDMICGHPWPDRGGPYATGAEYRDYLNSFAEKNRLFGSIEFNAQVEGIREFGNPGFLLTVNNQHKFFDYMIDTTGPFNTPVIPPQADLIKGKVMHAADFKTLDSFDTHNLQHVIVVGGSFTGFDIASWLADKHGIKVTHVMTRAPYMVERMQNGTPLDVLTFTREGLEARDKLSLLEQNRAGHEALSRMAVNSLTNQNSLKVTTPRDHPPYIAVTHPAYTEYASRGRITAQLGRFLSNDGTTAILEDGTRLEGDAIIFATGHTKDFSMYDPEILEKIGYRPDRKRMPVEMYLGLCNPNVPGFGMIGGYFGPFPKITEVQAEMCARMIEGSLDIPEEVMWQDINAHRAIAEHAHPPQFIRYYPAHLRAGLQMLGLWTDNLHGPHLMPASLNPHPVLRHKGPGEQLKLAV